jgi:SAM-dependent methyltransferase
VLDAGVDRPRRWNTGAWAETSPSRTLLKFARTIADSSRAPALDVACGFGRNAVALAAHGCDVVCLDGNLLRLRKLQASGAHRLSDASDFGRVGSLMPICTTVSEAHWPFPADSFSAVISVHFIETALFKNYFCSLISGGYLYFETYGGQAGNYLALPAPNQIRVALDDLFTILFYVEKRLRLHPNAVTVKTLARKR